MTSAERIGNTARRHYRPIVVAAVVGLLWSMHTSGQEKDLDFGYPPEFQRVRAAVRQLSREEQMDLLRTPFPKGYFPGPLEVEQRQYAFSALRMSGLTVSEVRELIGLAATNELSIHPLTVFSGIWGPVYESSATDEQKAITDELLKLLISLLEDKPSVSSYVVECMFRMANLPQKPPQVARQDQGSIRPEIPYRNLEVVTILLDILQHHPSPYVRQDAARGLGVVGANDPDLALRVIKALEKQIPKEEATSDWGTIRSCGITRSLPWKTHATIL